MKRPEGPGPAKARPPALLRVRAIELWQGNDYRWSELLAAADIMSEGAARQDADGLKYYGSTSVLLARAALGARTKSELDELARLVQSDPHTRVRAIRVACLEARLRAPRPLGVVHAELRVRVDRRGIWIDIDLEAPVSSDAERQPVHSARGTASRRKSRRLSTGTGH